MNTSFYPLISQIFSLFKKTSKPCLVLIWFAIFLTIPLEAATGVKKYIVNIEPNFREKTIKGTTQVIFENNIDEQIVFPIYGIQIEKVQAGGKSIGFTVTENQLKIEPTSLNKVEIYYHGSPTKGLFWGDDYVYSNFDPCGWMICYEDVAIRSPIEIRLTFPANFKSVANGQLIRSNDGKNLRTDIWREDNGYASYLYGFVIGKFTKASEIFKGVNHEYLAVSDTQKNLKDKFKQTTELAMEFFEKKSGVPFPSKNYSQVLVQNSEAQEKQGFAIIGHGFVDPILKDPQEDWAIVHELAHQWWGNNITCKSWDHFWLNEGLVVFMTAAYKQERWGQAAYDREMDLARKRYQNAIDAKFDVPLTFKGEYPSLGIKRAIVYSKGALFLNALRKEVGDEIFWKGIKFYTMAFKFKSVVSKDFQSQMEKASKKDLSKIFEKWVY